MAPTRTIRFGFGVGVRVTVEDVVPVVAVDLVVRGVAVDRMQCLEVGTHEGAEQQPRSLDRPGGLVHGVTVREGF